MSCTCGTTLVGDTDMQTSNREPLSPPDKTLHGQVAPRLRHGDLLVDPVAFAARYRGKLLNLRPNEFRLLAFFVANPDRVFSRAALIQSLGKDSDLLDER